jgi:hypothetical protein
MSSPETKPFKRFANAPKNSPFSYTCPSVRLSNPFIRRSVIWMQSLTKKLVIFIPGPDGRELARPLKKTLWRLRRAYRATVKLLDDQS